MKYELIKFDNKTVKKIKQESEKYTKKSSTNNKKIQENKMKKIKIDMQERKKILEYINLLENGKITEDEIPEEFISSIRKEIINQINNYKQN